MVAVLDKPNTIPGIYIPQKVWLEMNAVEDACDVLVQMEDGNVFTALFVVVPYIKRQMDLFSRMTNDFSDTTSVRYATLDMPHVVVEELTRDTIEDAVDNLIALGTFGSTFVRVTEDDKGRTMSDCERATQEVAAVVISDVLRVNA